MTEHEDRENISSNYNRSNGSPRAAAPLSRKVTMKHCSVIRIKKVTLRSNSPISEDRLTREHHALEKRAPKETDLLGGIYLDEDKARNFCDYCNKYLSQKEWVKNNPEGIKDDYYVEIRKFYIETQLLWD